MGWAVCWSVFVQRQVCSHAVVVFNIISDDSSQMPLANNNRVIQTLATNRPNDPLDIGFCQGERGAVTTSVSPTEAILWLNALP